MLVDPSKGTREDELKESIHDAKVEAAKKGDIAAALAID